MTARALRVVPLAAIALFGACTVGAGSGRVQGALFVQGCGTEGENLSADSDVLTPVAFDLDPTFFAGEPIEDIARGGILTNRLIIRIQRNGNSIEVNDTLYFDVRDVREVARCLRGRTEGGVPDWDDDGGWCDWTGGAGGAVRAERPRIYLGPKRPVSATLSLMYTCTRARVMGVAVDREMARGSWIELLEFGGAAQARIVDPEQRDAVPFDFKVDFSERLEALFRIDLEDERRIEAVQEMDPLPPARIAGTLGGTRETGYFGFTLERSRAAQPFP